MFNFLKKPKYKIEENNSGDFIVYVYIEYIGSECGGHYYNQVTIESSLEKAKAHIKAMKDNDRAQEVKNTYFID